MNQSRRSKRQSGTINDTKNGGLASPVPPTLLAIDDELQKAMDTVLITRDRAKQLHSMWRNHLWKLSFLVSFLSMYQSQQPFTLCITSLKKKMEPLSDYSAFYTIIGENMCEVVNMINSLLLSYFLSIDNPQGSLSHWSFVVASSFTPLCIGLFYHSNRIGCFDTNFTNHDESQKRQFPVSAVFQFIVTGCYWFMHMEMEKYERNVEMVKRLHMELSESRLKNLASKKK
jgi:hypothetical protein